MTSCALLELYQQCSVCLAWQLPWSAGRSSSTWLCQNGLLNHLCGQGAAEMYPPACPFTFPTPREGKGGTSGDPPCSSNHIVGESFAPSEMVPGTVQHLRDAGDKIQGGPERLRAQFGCGSPPAHKTIVRNTEEQKDFHGVGRL